MKHLRNLIALTALAAMPALATAQCRAFVKNKCAASMLPYKFNETFNAAQLKTIQEVITLSVFAIFSWAYLGEKLTWQHGVGFAFIALGAWFIFQGRG